MRFPVGTMKIGRSFVGRLATGSRETALTESLVSLADKLGMVVVAEGVETAEQAETLQRLGCKFGQGYLYARPMSARNLTAVLREGSLQPTESCSVLRTRPLAMT